MKNLFKSSIGFIAGLMSVSSAYALSIWDGSSMATGLTGSGNYYTISTAEEFVYFVKNQSTFSADAKIELRDDISLGGNRLPVVTYYLKFAGEFDGNNHCIIDRQSTSYTDGSLFGEVSGKVYNLGSVVEVKGVGGAIAYKVLEGGSIFYCYNRINGYAQDQRTAPIAIYNYGSVVECVAEGRVEQRRPGRDDTFWGLGGIVCDNYGYANCNVGGTGSVGTLLRNNCSNLDLVRLNGSVDHAQYSFTRSEEYVGQDVETYYTWWYAKYWQYGNASELPNSVQKTITFVDNYGISAYPSQTLSFGAEYTLPVPSVEGNIFDGWYSGGKKYTSLTSTMADYQFEARWIQKITQQPTTSSLQVEVTDREHAIFQWYKLQDSDLEALEGETGSSVSAKNLKDGYYVCKISYSNSVANLTTNTVNYVLPSLDVTTLDNVIYADDVNTAAGSTVTLPILMKNQSADITGFQFNLTLPAGFSANASSIAVSSNRATPANFSIHALGTTEVFVDCYSNSTTAFVGTSGEVATITVNVPKDVTGEYKLLVSNIVMATKTGEEISIDGVVKSAITVHKLTLIPAKDATCVTNGNEAYYTCSHCNQLFVDADATVTTTLADVTIAKQGHAYADTPTWTWEGFTSAKAELICGNDPSHVISATATITDAMTVEATCTQPGERTYTATVQLNNLTYTDTKTEPVAVAGHSYQYTNTYDGKHTVTCANCDYSEVEEHTHVDGVCTSCGDTPVTSITLGNVPTEMAISQTVTLTASVLPANATISAVTWSSSNTGIATVSEAGVVTAVGKGEVIITAEATDQSGQKASSQFVIYLLGDANGNGKVNIADVTTIAAKLNGITPTNFYMAPANANFSDNNALNVADITSVISIIRSGATYLAPKRGRDSEVEPSVLYVDPITMMPGRDTEISIMVSNPSQSFSAFEFTMLLPDGVSLKHDFDGNAVATLSNVRTEGAAFSARVMDDGTVYVLCYSTDNTQFRGNSGEVARLTLVADSDVAEGQYEGKLTSIMLSAYGEENPVEDQIVNVSTLSPSGIELISDNENGASIYDINGRMIRSDASFDHLPAGIYVINGKKIQK